VELDLYLQKLKVGDNVMYYLQWVFQDSNSTTVQSTYIGNENQILAKINTRRKMSKVIEFGPEARKKLVKGIDKL
jgi:hypothetical protein